MAPRLQDDFRAAEAWLRGLITDRHGARYERVVAPETRMLERQQSQVRMLGFLRLAGDPQAAFRSIHVAGTSGKGSVVTLLAAILRQAGQRTGHHVSPYLQVCTEKLSLDGGPLPAAKFVALVQAFRALHERWLESGGQALPYAEAWLALTCLWLARERVDWAVVEAGVGGRHDPSNLLPARLAVITSVGLDHLETLGPTLADVAHHKAGIVKADQLAITGVRDPALLAIIRAEARAQGTRLYAPGAGFEFTCHALTPAATHFSVRTPHHDHRDLWVALPGRFQAANAALAVAAADVIASDAGFELTPEMVQRGLREARIPGRMEVIQQDPVVILDGAHNPQKMGALTDALQTLYPGRRLIVVIGLLATKDADAMLTTLAPLVSHWIVTEPHVLGKPSLPAVALAAAIRLPAPGAAIELVERVGLGIECALAQADADTVVLVTGSLYMLGEARNRWVPPEALILGALPPV